MELENKILLGDCLDIMSLIPDNSIDMVLCDLPYGTTQCKWDSVIDLKKLWSQYVRICKENACIALFAQSPFDKLWVKLNEKYEIIKSGYEIFSLSTKSEKYISKENLNKKIGEILNERNN